MDVLAQATGERPIIDRREPGLDYAACLLPCYLDGTKREWMKLMNVTALQSD